MFGHVRGGARLSDLDQSQLEQWGEEIKIRTPFLADKDVAPLEAG